MRKKYFQFIWSCVPSSAVICVSLLAVAEGENYTSWCASRFTTGELAAGIGRASEDADQDGQNNLLEYFGGTDPRNGSSLFVTDAVYDPALAMGLFQLMIPQDREDVEYEVQLSDDLAAWNSGAVLIGGPIPAIWRMEGYHFARIVVKVKAGFFLDSDGDGMDDAFEQLLIDADPNDGIATLGDVRPEDDYDGDGIRNLDEARYGLNGLGNDAEQAGEHIQYQYEFDILIGVQAPGMTSLNWSYDENINFKSLSE